MVSQSPSSTHPPSSAPKTINWESLAPPRRHLFLFDTERVSLAPSVWAQSVAPRWKLVLTRLISGTKMITENPTQSPKDQESICGNSFTNLASQRGESQSLQNNEQHEVHTDTLIMALTELWYGIIFYRISSHLVSELLKQVIIEICLTDEKVGFKAPDTKDKKLDHVIKSQESNLRSQSPDRSSINRRPISELVSHVCETTELKSAVLDSLRWSIEYTFDGVERLINQYEKKTSQSRGQSPKSSDAATSAVPNASRQVTTTLHHQQQLSVQAQTSAQIYPRVLSVLEAVEKSLILTKTEIIGTIPYSQLDQLRYVNAKDNSNLLKVNVRMRTKDLFTLQVYNLESENPCGYAQLHLLLQTFLVYGTTCTKPCQCAGKRQIEQHRKKVGAISSAADCNERDEFTSSTLTPPPWEESVSDCQCLTWLEVGILDLITEFSLCVNRVIEILLVYWQHWIFVLKHEVLRVIKNLISREKLEELLVFQMRSYEDALEEGRICARGMDVLVESKSSIYLAPQKFFHLCAFLVMEGLISLELVWVNMGPTEAALQQLSAKASGLVRGETYDAEIKEGDSTISDKVENSKKDGTKVDGVKEDSVPANRTIDHPTDDEWVLNDFKTKTPEQIYSFLMTQPLSKLRLISAFIDLNGWNFAVLLLKRFSITCPQWSFHLCQDLLVAFGRLICWVGDPLYRQSAASFHQISKYECTSSFVKRSTKSGQSKVFLSYEYDDDTEMIPINENETIEVKHSTALGTYPAPYHYGLLCKTKYGSSTGLSQITTPNEFVNKLLPLLRLLGVGLGSLPASFVDVVLEIIAAACACQKTSQDEKVEETLSAPIFSYLSEVVLPSLCLCEPRLTINVKLWSILKFLPVQRRHALYAGFFYVGRFIHPKVVAAASLVRRTIGREMKRMTAEQSDGGRSALFASSGGGESVFGQIVVRSRAQTTQRERVVIDTLAKLSSVNPFEVIDVILHQIEMFDTMLTQVIINHLPTLSDFSADVAAFLITERMQCRELLEGGEWNIREGKPKKLRNTAHFAARFHRRFPHVDLRPLVLSICSRLSHEALDSNYPDRLTGKLGDVVYLEELLIWIGGAPTVSTEEMGIDQLLCSAAGPTLRQMILMDSELQEEFYRPGSNEARTVLKDIFSEKMIFRTLLFALSTLKLEIQYDSQLQCGAKSLQLRIVASLVDELHLSLLQFLDFVALPDESQLPTSPAFANLSKDIHLYASMLPSVSDILRFCEVPVVWTVIRPAISPIYRSESPSIEDDTSGLEAEGIRITATSLTEIARRLLGDNQQHCHLLDLYITFWRLDLQDVWVPESVYDKQISSITKDIEHISSERKNMRRTSDEEQLIHEELDLAAERLAELKRVFEMELKLLREHRARVICALQQAKNRWFQPHDSTNSNAMANFIQFMLAARVLNSHKDALFCAKFVEVLIEIDVDGFDVLDFFNKWTGMLTPLVRSCTLQEADYLGLFVNDMFAMMIDLVMNCEKREHIRDRSCLSRLFNIRKLTADVQSSAMDDIPKDIEMVDSLCETVPSIVDSTAMDKRGASADLSDLMKSIGKWENRIFRLIQHGLSLTEKETSWMSQRVVIKFLNKTHQNFPVTDLAGRQILSALPALIERAKENRWDDVVANAKALDRNLHNVEKRWLKRKEDEVDEAKPPVVAMGGPKDGQVPVEGVKKSEPSFDDTDMEKQIKQPDKKPQTSTTPKIPFVASGTSTSVISLEDGIASPTPVNKVDEEIVDKMKVVSTKPEPSKKADMIDVDEASLQNSQPSELLEPSAPNRRSETEPPPSKRQRVSDIDELQNSSKPSQSSEYRHTIPTLQQQPVILPPPTLRIEIDTIKQPVILSQPETKMYVTQESEKMRSERSAKGKEGESDRTSASLTIDGTFQRQKDLDEFKERLKQQQKPKSNTPAAVTSTPPDISKRSTRETNSKEKVDMRRDEKVSPRTSGRDSRREPAKRPRSEPRETSRDEGRKAPHRSDSGRSSHSSHRSRDQRDGREEGRYRLVNTQRDTRDLRQENESREVRTDSRQVRSDQRLVKGPPQRIADWSDDRASHLSHSTRGQEASSREETSLSYTAPSPSFHSKSRNVNNESVERTDGRHRDGHSEFYQGRQHHGQMAPPPPIGPPPPTRQIIQEDRRNSTSEGVRRIATMDQMNRDGEFKGPRRRATGPLTRGYQQPRSYR